jgi:hypothetical protein
MRALDQLMAAVTMQPQRKTIDLPNGDVFEFWMTPLTLAERTRAQKQAKSDDATDFAMQLLISKAKDSSGQPMFVAGELADLRNKLPSWLVDALLLKLLQQDEAKDDGEEEEEDSPLASKGRSKRTTG